jgi:pantothenate kinase
MNHLPELPASARIRARELIQRSGRALLGLVGPPGAGKSTLAAALQAEFANVSQVVPMDGFHLANVELARLGRRGRKGAPDTFDSAGYVALLRRLLAQADGEIVYAPEFRREIEEPIANAIPILAGTQLVVTEGNYLLLDDGPWAEVRTLLDEIWYVDVDDAMRVDRLTQRHVQFGRSADAAAAWVAGTDEPNARLIEASRARASFVFRWDDE